jgi:hypothetical protein
MVKSTRDGFACQVETNNTFVIAGYAFSRTSIKTLIPLNKFFGHSRIECKVVLQLQQQALLVMNTLARRPKDTNAKEK